eukprot:3542221-Alexandrium_andersonii.AAC.1
MSRPAWCGAVGAGVPPMHKDAVRAGEDERKRRGHSGARAVVRGARDDEGEGHGIVALGSRA